MNKIEKKIIDTIGTKSVLFLENDFGLYNSVGNFEKVLLENNMSYGTVFNLGKVSTEYVVEVINFFEVIVFESTWTSEKSAELEDLLSSRAITYKKIIVECYIHEPRWWYKPKDTKHDMYVCHSFDGLFNKDDGDDWKFDLLDETKPIWEGE